VKRTAFVVSHTHWDREWYLTFQQFRMRLVDMVDTLLDVLARDAEFRHFMMDGQTIVLDDYLEVRPGRREELAKHVQEGRISIGPWYVLPDEALVSGEALVRNLMAGERSARRFGRVMPIGYLPDTFGHINQLPQIARGWGLKAVVVTRGVPDSPCEFLWDGPDDVPVLAINLRRSYGNALYLCPGENLVPRLRNLADDLAAHATTSYLLFMNGMDHHFPEPAVPEALRQANAALPDLQLVHGSLRQFVGAVSVANPAFEHRTGEMRDHQMHDVLPGVLSTRMWIKQRNGAAQRLLERWAEPFSAWAHRLGGRDRRPFLWQAWRYLLQNHPHDSICGCSIDQVHEEMKPRFDWVAQIGDKVLAESLDAIAGQALSATGERVFRVVVLNSEGGPRTDVVRVAVEMPVEGDTFALRDEADGCIIPVEVLHCEEQPPFSFVVDAETTQWLLVEMAEGSLVNKRIRRMSMKREGRDVYLDFLAGEVGGPDERQLAEFVAEVKRLTDLGEELVFHYQMHYPPKVDVRFVARGVPAMGYRVLTVVPAEPGAGRGNARMISNEFFAVHASATDGTLILVDRGSGATLSGLNQFVDGGEAGDEYSYCPPLKADTFVTGPARPPTITVEHSAVAQTLRIAMVYRVPAALAADRSTRADEAVDLPIETTVTLYAGVRRVDVETWVDNGAQDHRLRVHFPTGIVASQGWADAAFDVVSRPAGTPACGQDWHEQPVPTWPQQRFADVHDGTIGLMVASDGLPEYEVMTGQEGHTIAVTLLRCVGWLSRGDLLTRSGNAGPTIATPGAQCPGRHCFRYSIIPHQGGWEQAFLEAHAFVTPMCARQVWGRPAVTPARSLLNVRPAEVIVSAVKLPEEGEGIVVRIYNPLPHAVEAQLTLGLPFEAGVLTNLREEPDPAEHVATGARFTQPGRFEMRLEAKRIQTVLFR